MRRLAVGLGGLATGGLVLLACSGGSGSNSGGGGTGGSGGGPSVSPKVGAPCRPSDEASFRFGGYRVTEDVIEPGAPECGGGVCLVNHMQGRVSCPLGQAAPVDAQGLAGCTPEKDPNGNFVAGQGSCADGAECVQAGSYSPACSSDEQCSSVGAGLHCGADGACECNTDADCLFISEVMLRCDVGSHHCVSFACHVPGACQSPSATDEQNAGKACCLPGTDTPVTADVCGQCEGVDGHTTRDASRAVYCSCRCGVAEGAPDEPDTDFCACPSGFECTEIRRFLGLGDPKNTGKYCVLAGTAYDGNQDQCGLVDGYWGESCAGVATGKCQSSGSPCN